MYFEPIVCTVDEAKRNAAHQQKQMQSYDAELKVLYKRLHELEWAENPEYSQELCELREQIYRLEDSADYCERYMDYWLKQAEWARTREETA